MDSNIGSIGSASEGGIRRGERAASALRDLGPIIVGWALPFVLVLYLALRRGGYDIEIWSEVGIVLWGVVLIGALAGVLPAHRIRRPAWIAFGLLFALCAWTALSMLWSESIERSFDETARVAMLVGAFALALTSQGREGPRRAVGGVAAAIAVIAGLALLSRFEPSLFPANEAAADIVRARLNYPLNYWNGLATLMAIGLPLLLTIAVDARKTVTRVLATAALPLLGLTLFFTFSRGGLIAAAIALGTLFALHPRRADLLVPTLLGAVGTGLLIGLATKREPIIDFIPEAVPSFPGDPRDFEPMAAEMLVATVLVAFGVGLIRIAALLATRYGLVPSLRLPFPSVKAVLAVAAVVVAVAAIAFDAPGRLADGWEEFKNPEVAATSSERFETASGNGRYQYWQSSLDALGDNPLGGTGAGTFEFWWDRNGTLSSLVKDAHSLVFETAGELGAIGAILIVSFVGAVLILGARRTRTADPGVRGYLAAAVAGGGGFAFGMTIDWGWELAVLPVVFLLLAAALLTGGGEEPPREERSQRPRPVAWLALAVLSVPALALLIVSLVGARAVLDSQAAFRSSDYDAALESAETAESVQPWAAAPQMQQAFALAEMGEFEAAIDAAREATEREPTNWETWAALSRVGQKGGDAAVEQEGYDRGRGLNPRSPVYGGEG